MVHTGFFRGNLRETNQLEDLGAIIRPRRNWEDNIKIYLEEVGWGHGLD